MPDASFGRHILKFLIFSFAYASLVLALCRPQFGSKLKEVKRRGVEVVIAMDVSNSMLAEDIKPQRLIRAKMDVSKLVDKLEDDKIGIVIFAGDAYTQLPITADFGAAKLFINTINTNFIPKQGTAIGSAIKLGIKSFTQDTEAGKALIIITDGENHEDDAIAAAKEAAEKGIIIHTIGMGSPQGSPIPVGPGQKAFRKDRNGEVIISKLNEQVLKEIAMNTGGIYVRASNNLSGLNIIQDEISKMKKTDVESKIYSDYEEKYQYFIALALIFLILEFMVLERRNKYFKNIKLFDINK